MIFHTYDARRVKLIGAEIRIDINLVIQRQSISRQLDAVSQSIELIFNSMLRGTRVRRKFKIKVFMGFTIGNTWIPRGLRCQCNSHFCCSRVTFKYHSQASSIYCLVIRYWLCDVYVCVWKVALMFIDEHYITSWWLSGLRAAIINPVSAGIDFRRRNLTSINVRF